MSLCPMRNIHIRREERRNQPPATTAIPPRIAFLRGMKSRRPPLETNVFHSHRGALVFVFSLLPSTVHDLIGHIGVVFTVEAEGDQSEVRFTGVGGAWAEVRFIEDVKPEVLDLRRIIRFLIPNRIPRKLDPPIRYAKNKQILLMVVL